MLHESIAVLPGSTDHTPVTAAARARLRTVVTALLSDSNVTADLRAERARSQAYGRTPGWFWEKLWSSFVTLGRAAPLGRLVAKPGLLERLRFPRLAAADPDDRRTELAAVFRSVAVAYPNKKAGQLAAAVARIVSIGGVHAAEIEILMAPTPAAKLEILRQYRGLGEKYARNVLMDIDHPHARDWVAVDYRLENIATNLGLVGWRFFPARRHSDLRNLEAFYRQVARDAAVDAWTLDRLLFRNSEAVLTALGVPPRTRRPPMPRRVVGRQLPVLSVT